MTTVEILKEMAFTATETQRKALEDAISAISDYKKMQEITARCTQNAHKVDAQGLKR